MSSWRMELREALDMAAGGLAGVVLRLLCGGLVAVVVPAAALAEPSRVRMKLDVQGELFATVDQDGDSVRQPITVAARFDFLDAAAAADAAPAAAIRTFADAAAEIIVDGRTERFVLPADARRVLVARVGTAPIPYLAHGFLTRAELDLLEVPFDAMLLPELRPRDVVAAGDNWTVPPDVAAGLLAIDTVETGGIKATVEDVADLRAQVTLSGIVEGAVDGVPTHLVIEGSCVIVASPDISSDADALRYRLDGDVTNVAVTLHERRQPSHVAPGLDVEARIVVTAAEHETAEAAAAEPSDVADRRRGPGRPGLVWHRDGAGRFDLVHDARWRTVEEAEGSLVMRYIDRGALVAQCSITALPPAAASSLPTVAEVQRDIRRSLAEQFERFEAASAATRSDGVTVVRVESAGTAEKLPFRWVHYVLADKAGRRASVAFMMEAPLAKRFGEADQALIDGLSLDDAPATREARVPRKTATP